MFGLSLSTPGLHAIMGLKLIEGPGGSWMLGPCNSNGNKVCLFGSELRRFVRCVYMNQLYSNSISMFACVIQTQILL